MTAGPLPDPGDWYLQVNRLAAATPILHGVAAAWATYGLVALAVLMVTAWWVSRSRSDVAMAGTLLAPVSVVLAYLLNQPVARLVGEARPYVAHPAALVLVGRTTDPSFPSDHAVVAGSACVAVWLVSRRLGIAAAATAVLLAASRVYVGVHYPVDVLVGLAEGGVVAVVVWLAACDAVARWVQRLRGTGIGSRFLGAPGTTGMRYGLRPGRTGLRRKVPVDRT